MRTRLKDIAEDLKISAGLVSGVLNGRENVWASEQTRQRIFDAAKRLNYAHNASTKTRQPASAGAIELVFCREDLGRRSDLATILEALSAEVERLNWTLMVSSFSDAKSAAEYLAGQSNTRTDPIVLWGNDADVAEMGTVLEATKIPFLVHGRQGNDGRVWPQFAYDVEEMIVGAVDHIRVHGHRRIAYVGDQASSSAGRLMRETFIRWIHSTLGETPSPEFVIESDGSYDDYRNRIGRLLELDGSRQPTGFVMSGGNDAWTALETALADHGSKLGFGKTDRAAAGTFEGPMRLLFGAALGYDLSDGKACIATTLGPLLEDLIQNSNSEPVRLYLPRLTRVPSLHLGLPENPGLKTGVSL
jgi:DNA-binding LacI/PurR family transcriptional regulator